jgi:hypothetical protein
MIRRTEKEKEKTSQLDRLKKQFKNDTRLGKDDQFPFGKYAGHTVRDILKHNPGYIVWWSVNIDTYQIRKKVVAQARAADLDRHAARQVMRSIPRYLYQEHDTSCLDDIWDDVGRMEVWGD